MTQGENLSLQVSTHSEGTSERPQQRKQDGHHRFGRLHGRARKFKGIKADGVFGRDTYPLPGLTYPSDSVVTDRLPRFYKSVTHARAAGHRILFGFLVMPTGNTFKPTPQKTGSQVSFAATSSPRRGTI